MTEEEIKNKISEHKECCKKLAEEYRQRYNEDNADKLALNMFYHNVISYNDFETVLATIEDRNSMIMCFSEPPYLTEETVEVNIKRIAELEKENAELKNELKKWKDGIALKDEEIGCIETDFNTFKSKAKELLERLLITSCNSDVINLLPNCSEVLRVRAEAEQFLNDEGCPDCLCKDCTKDCGIKKFGLVEVEK